MDLFEKIASSLEPLGGDLHVDAFARARLEAAARRRAAEEAAAAAASDAARTVRAPRITSPARAAPPPAPARPAASPDDTGSLRAEVEEFMKERAGFDPSELE